MDNNDLSFFSPPKSLVGGYIDLRTRNGMQYKGICHFVSLESRPPSIGVAYVKNVRSEDQRAVGVKVSPRDYLVEHTIVPANSIVEMQILVVPDSWNMRTTGNDKLFQEQQRLLQLIMNKWSSCSVTSESEALVSYLVSQQQTSSNNSKSIMRNSSAFVGPQQVDVRDQNGNKIMLPSNPFEDVAESFQALSLRNNQPNKEASSFSAQGLQGAHLEVCYGRENLVDIHRLSLRFNAHDVLWPHLRERRFRQQALNWQYHGRGNQVTGSTSAGGGQGNVIARPYQGTGTGTGTGRGLLRLYSN